MNYVASFIVSAKPLPPTSRSSSAGSSNLGTSLYPAHKGRDVDDVVLAETMNEANYFWVDQALWNHISDKAQGVLADNRRNFRTHFSYTLFLCVTQENLV